MHPQDGSPRESTLRSFFKAVTYRITGTLTTGAITYLVTGELGTAIAIGGIEPVAKIVIYYLHERAWQRVPLGTIRRLAHLKPPRSTV